VPGAGSLTRANGPPSPAGRRPAQHGGRELELDRVRTALELDGAHERRARERSGDELAHEPVAPGAAT
jgi:hypothetical protein